MGIKITSINSIAKYTSANTRGFDSKKKKEKSQNKNKETTNKNSEFVKTFTKYKKSK